MLPDADFPAVILEVGWNESFEALKDDARLWLLHTNGETRVVILVAFIESNGGSSPEVGNNGSEVEKAIPDVGEGKSVMGVADDAVQGSGEKYAEERMPLSEEQMVVESIDETTGYHALAARLLDLNRKHKLKEPLIGNLRATVHVYKACEDGKDITESFIATLLPPPEGDSEEAEKSGLEAESVDLLEDRVPKDNDPTTQLLPLEGDLEEEDEISGFWVELGDLFGDNFPKGHKKKNKVIFSLKELEEFVRTSLPATEKDRSLTRAAKLLSEAGQWEKRETWAQSKRRRLA